MHTFGDLRSAERQHGVAAGDPSPLLLSASPERVARSSTLWTSVYLWLVRPRSAARSPRRGLHLICAAEVFTGFALYVLSALLVLFLSERDGYSPSRALRFVGTFNGLCYVGPLLGGWLADRVLGFRWAVLLGAVVLCAGFGTLARVPSAPLLSAGLLVIGSALFRSNVVALVGRSVHANKVQREATYRRLYLAFNGGAMVAPPTAAWLRAEYGWAAPFAACALAMAGVVLLLASAYPHLAADEQSGNEPQENAGAPDSPDLGRGAPKWRIITLLLVVTALWASCVGQSDGTLLLWARDHVRRVLLGHEVPASVFASLPALLVLLLAPLVGMLRRFSVTRSTSSRIIIGMWSTALAMALMALASLLAGGAPSSAAWLLGCFAFLIVGEVLVGPLTQSVLSGLAPPSRHGLVLAASYGAIAIGYWLAGSIGALWLRWPKPAFFGLLACVALLGGLLLKFGAQLDDAD